MSDKASAGDCRQEYLNTFACARDFPDPNLFGTVDTPPNTAVMTAALAARTASRGRSADRVASSAAEALWVSSRRSRRPGEVYRRDISALLGTVAATRWPLTLPTPHQLDASPRSIQRVWREAFDPRAHVWAGRSWLAASVHARAPWAARLIQPTHPISALIDSHARAQRLELDWDDPVQRAIAERTSDEVHTRALLTTARHSEPPDPGRQEHRVLSDRRTTGDRPPTTGPFVAGPYRLW